MNWKVKNEKKKIILNLFCLKPISKDKNQNFQFQFLISNQKMNFYKFFLFSILVMKLKNEKWKIFKIRFVFKSKNELYFRYTDYKTNWFFDFQNNRILKFKFEVCFSFFILIWKTKNQICLNKYLMKLVTISPYAITRNKYKRIK